MSDVAAVAGSSEQRRWPMLSVIGGSAQVSTVPGLRRALIDGTAAIGVGAAVAGGFGVGAVRGLVSGDAAGRWWLVALAAVGVLLILGGFWLRRRANRPVRVGVVVSARDARRGLAKAEQLDQAARAFVTQGRRVALYAGDDLHGTAADAEVVDGLAEATHTAVVFARRLTTDNARVDLVPTMPLHAAFRFGARLGYTHTTEIIVHALTGSYFPALMLAVYPCTAVPLVVEPVETVAGGEDTVTALALDLQNRGATFLAQVRAACRELGAGRLLVLRSAGVTVSADFATFSGVVEQVCRVWRDAALSEGARTGRHGIFLSGPAAIAVGLGARLAASDSGRWTAFTLDGGTGKHESMRAGPAT
ncbi:MAG: SAVED domain-containing protein [Sciscionella sp.]